jgi:hypothetical protein
LLLLWDEFVCAVPRADVGRERGVVLLLLVVLLLVVLLLLLMLLLIAIPSPVLLLRIKRRYLMRIVKLSLRPATLPRCA